jgi:heterodisulfide reductase subunit A-like polyferredoxin
LGWNSPCAATGFSSDYPRPGGVAVQSLANTTIKQKNIRYGRNLVTTINTSSDALVIGAGLAGLYAVYELRRQGYSIFGC